MIRGTTQCLTGKAEGPHHPFFIGSRPGPVFCGGIFPGCRGNCARCGDSAHRSIDLTLRCWFCPCLLRSALVLARLYVPL
uniref:Uncharacterized protein n=1 Tax=Phocoena sinus TaxID=42100 RepID=A0A8C9BM34_PHOSS